MSVPPGGEPDSVLHTIQNCNTTTSFHNQLLNWFKEMHNTSISPAIYELLFGTPCGKENNILRKLNFSLVFVNYHLHYHKINERNLDWVELTTKVKYKLRIENRFWFSFMMLLRSFCPVNGFKRY